MTKPVDFLQQISDFTFTSKYARYNEKAKRRETWEEAVHRLEKMHLKRFSNLDEADKSEIRWAFDQVRSKLVAPSMRSLQFGGKAVEAQNARLFNCSVRHVDSLRSFSEIFHLLLCGCGVGIGLNKDFLGRLPDLVNKDDKTGTVITYVIEDTIEGWADSIEALLNCYFKNTAYTGRKITFDYSRIRKKGEPLKTGGGKAPGYRGLKASHVKIKELLDHIIEDKHQKRMQSIDAYDVLMHAADAVLSGGVRRSATIVVFQPEDNDMMKAKTGNWFEKNPQRARSNNSVLILRNEASFEQFKDVINKTKEFGEPGFIFSDHKWLMVNPCSEIQFLPVTKGGVCGIQMCNLTTQNGALIDNLDKFAKATKAATIIGTLQAAYTEFSYLGKASKELTEEEALLGVSITGIMDNPGVLLDPKNQKVCAELAVSVNLEWAKKIGINPAARITCVKPEGTSSLVLGTASGIHPHHARRYFRRMQFNRIDPVFKFLKKHNPHACEESIWSAHKTDEVVMFPISIPEKAMVKEELTAIGHLDIIKSTQQNWVIPGTTRGDMHHSVSCTVLVKDDEWDSVAKYLYDNRHFFSAVSLLPAAGDKIYKQAPMEAITTPEDEAKWTDLTSKWKEMDFTELKEEDDETQCQNELACAGGACTVL